ncbi:hypothetical protein [Paenibacillus piscarius]|uniref:hypothetical protein n=1 Tax=Paenibacillus piscarius TaxID=1089681 RepID=UPI001EE7B394|nr:hypothetical protein [Paenibacillus piscarius]
MTSEAANSTTIEAPPTDYIVDVQDILIAPLETDVFSPKVIISGEEQRVHPLGPFGPVWVTKQWDVVKTGNTVDVLWKISTDTIIRQVSAYTKL